jgi:hypothetical protein
LLARWLHPVLDELESFAELEGITLEEAIDQYVADVAGPDWQQHEPGYPGLPQRRADAVFTPATNLSRALSVQVRH